MEQSGHDKRSSKLCMASTKSAKALGRSQLPVAIFRQFAEFSRDLDISAKSTRLQTCTVEHWRLYVERSP